MSTLIKSAQFIRHSFVFLVCFSLAVLLIWRTIAAETAGDMTGNAMSIALGLCLILTGIAATAEGS